MTGKAKILIVEDETIVSLHLRNSLKKLGYSVSHSVTSGEQALEFIAKKVPDLILMDIMLDGKLDGISTSEKIQKDHDVPIIYLSAYSDNKTLGRAKATFPCSYLTKPFKDEDLKANIELALSNFRRGQKSEKDFQWILKILNSTNSPLVGFDKKGEIQIVTNSLSQYCKASPDKMLGLPIEEALKIFEINGEPITLELNEVFANEKSIYYGCIELQIMGEKRQTFSAFLHPLMDKKMETIGGVMLLKKIEDAKKEWVKNERLSNHLCDIINFLEKPSLDIEICPWCKKIFDPENEEWVNIEIFIRNKNIEDTAHCICPNCAKSLGLDIEKIKRDRLN